MEEEEVSPIYVRKARRPYSGMVLDIFGLLIRSVGAIVVVGILLMLVPLLL